MLSTRLRWILPVIMLPVALAGCSSSSSTGAGPSSAAGVSASAGSDGTVATSTGGGSTGGGATGPSKTTATRPARPASSGCAPNSLSIPKKAGTAKTVDLDHDGKRDTLWLADSGTTRKLGVKTASGAVLSTTFTSAAPQAATAIGQRLGDGSEIILLNTGRSVLLFAVADCAIVPAQNLQGHQYTFDLGFTGFGTGVRCVNAGRGLELAGMLAQAKGSSYTVYQTRIALSDAGRQARNITRQTLATKASAGSSVVTSAQTVSCGTKTGAANEPQS